MERFESLLGRIISAGKKDVKKVEQTSDEIVEEAIGPPPAPSPALADVRPHQTLRYQTPTEYAATFNETITSQLSAA